MRDPDRRPHALAQLAALREALRRAEREATDPVRRGQPCAPPSNSAPPGTDRSERATFAHSVGPVVRLRSHGRIEPEPARTPARPLQREHDENQALRATLCDPVDADTLLETDEALSFRRPHIGADVLRKLRRGGWVIQAQVDLHGLARDAARERLAGFIHDALRRGLRCVRVVHGKGLGSPGRQPVLKARVPRWLAQHDRVLAFAQARAVDGGAGALVVLLGAGEAVPARAPER